MSEKINWSVTAQVTGGPSIKTSDTLTVDAYDKITAAVPDASVSATTTVDVQPGSTGVKFLFITASDYTTLTYTVDGGSSITLNDAHLLIGSGAAALLGATQKQFVFTNNSGAEITVSILVGRDATP